MTSKKAYYSTLSTVSGIEISNIYIKDNLLTDWETPSNYYIAGEGVLPTGVILTSIFVTENTATNGGDTIFCTTTSGIYVIDDDSRECVTYDNFRSATNYFKSVRADNKTSLTSGRFYVAHEKDLTVVNVTNGQAYVEDYFSLYSKGSTGDYLISEDIADINILFT